MKMKNYIKSAVVIALTGLLLTACGDSKSSESVNSLPVVDSETSTPEKTSLDASSLKKPSTIDVSTVKVLMEDKLTFVEGEERWVFGNDKFARSSIVTITFLDTLNDKMANEEAWDVSQEQDGTVMAWIKPVDREEMDFEGYDLYIAAEGGIVASSGEALFAGYENVTEIKFNNCFHTDGVTNMGYMFYDCNSLEQIDLSSFDTGSVTNMNSMFYGCSSLEGLVFGGSFDTSQVTDMSAMFYDCSNLKELDLGGFELSQETNTENMLYNAGITAQEAGLPQ